MNIDALVKEGNFAQIMRECFALLEKRHADVPGAAYKQNIDLRAYLQSLYNAQPKSLKNLPVSVAALAGVAHSWLSDGQTVEAIKAIPSLQFLEAGRQLERMFEPCIAHYTTLPIFDPQTDPHSADTEPLHTGIGIKEDEALFDLHGKSEAALKKVQSEIDTLSPSDQAKATMQKVVDGWAQRHGLKGSNGVQS